jgi:hypothetical protein
MSAVIALLDIYPREVRNVHTNTCSQMSIAQTINYQNVLQWVTGSTKLCYIHSLEHYSAAKEANDNACSSRRYAIMLCGKNQFQITAYWIILFV